MKKHVRWSLLLAAALLLIAVPIALAYTSASGRVLDQYGQPWTWGGTVVCATNATNVQIGSGTISTADGTWSVALASPSAATCTIDPAAGPEGDPGPLTCAIPGGGGGGVANYSCGDQLTGTGPNAVSLSGFSGSAFAFSWLLIPAGLVAGVLVWLRRR